MKKVKITVTQKDIEDGECGSPFRCAIAIAAQRAGIEAPEVGYPGFAGFKDGSRIRGDLPDTALAFINSFDDNAGSDRKAKPFSFHLSYY